MFLIVGLGNIGKKYEKTRHNVGFMIIDKLCEKFNIEMDKGCNTSIYGKGVISNERVICVKPTTFMNLSGDAVLYLMSYYKIPEENILIIYDDITLDFSKIRIREKGSHGGHNGIKDIIKKINTNKFKRIRIGIGENKSIDLSNYVLSNFTNEELLILDKQSENILKCVEMIVNGKIGEAMNLFN